MMACEEVGNLSSLWLEGGGRMEGLREVRPLKQAGVRFCRLLYATLLLFSFFLEMKGSQWWILIWGGK